MAQSRKTLFCHLLILLALSLAILPGPAASIDAPAAFCQECGAAVAADARFCSECGNVPAGPFPEIRRLSLAPGLELAMIRVPAGRFRMGAEDEEEDASPVEKPAHDVTLTRGCWMAESEISQAQWKTLMGTNPSTRQGERLPVESVSWTDCEAFCHQLQARFPDTLPVPTGETWLWRLPTEAEWEYGARGGQNAAFGWGPAMNDGFAVHAGNSGWETRPVGTTRPNAWGLREMSGNLWEWCADWLGDYRSAAATDPSGPADAARRAVRGGSWDEDAEGCRVSTRFDLNTSERLPVLGFRPVFAPPLPDRR